MKYATKRIITELQKADIRCVMVTGDNALTAVSVARQCGIVHPSQKIYIGEIDSSKNRNLRLK